jgi:hypothetical protein
MLLTRRLFLSILPAPLIVSAFNIMPVKVLRIEPEALDDFLVKYSWYRNGVLVEGATGPNYVLTAADIGARISRSWDATKWEDNRLRIKGVHNKLIHGP